MFAEFASTDRIQSPDLSHVGFSGLKYLAAGPSWVSGFGPYNNNLGGGEDPKMKEKIPCMP
jgi:hypothetical protein